MHVLLKVLAAVSVSVVAACATPAAPANASDQQPPQPPYSSYQSKIIQGSTENLNVRMKKLLARTPPGESAVWFADSMAVAEGHIIVRKDVSIVFAPSLVEELRSGGTIDWSTFDDPAVADRQIATRH